MEKSIYCLNDSEKYNASFIEYFNVDTIFVYSWILSMLAGNQNIIRLSSKTKDVREQYCGRGLFLNIKLMNLKKWPIF